MPAPRRLAKTYAERGRVYQCLSEVKATLDTSILFRHIAVTRQTVLFTLQQLAKAQRTFNKNMPKKDDSVCMIRLAVNALTL